MMADEDVIPLGVEGDDLAAGEFGFLIKERAEEPPDSTTEARTEIVQNDLRLVKSGASGIGQIWSA